VTEIVSWDDSFSVANQTLDMQHTRLLGMLNALSQAIETGEARSMIVLLLNALQRYTEAHFSAEEQLLERHGYPDLAAHRAKLQALTARVLEFQREFESGNQDISRPLQAFLHDWLLNHILETDKAYADFLREHGEV